MKICGIYSITHITTGLAYVGQSVDVHKRWSSHSRGCKTQRIGLAVLKHGWDKFSAAVLETCDREQLNDREIYWINKLNCISPSGFNLKTGGSQAVKFCDETKAKISAALKGRSVPAEARQKRAAYYAAHGYSKETRAKLAASRVGKKQKPESIAKTAAFNSGKKRPPEVIAKVAAALTGQKRTPEQRAKSSESLRGRKLSPDHIAKRTAAQTGAKRSAETIAKMSASRKAYFARMKSSEEITSAPP